MDGWKWWNTRFYPFLYERLEYPPTPVSRWGSAPKKECCCSAVAVFGETFTMAADALLLFDLVRPKMTLGTFLLCAAGFVLRFRPLYMAICCNEILWFVAFCKTFPAWWVLRRYRPRKPLLAATHSTSFENSHSTNSRRVSVIASISWILEHIAPAATDGLWDGSGTSHPATGHRNNFRNMEIVDVSKLRSASIQLEAWILNDFPGKSSMGPQKLYWFTVGPEDRPRERSKSFS